MADDDFKQSIEVLFGRNLATARLGAGLSENEVATRAGIAVVDLIQIESGTKDPDLRTIARLAKAVGRTPSELLNETPSARCP